MSLAKDGSTSTSSLMARKGMSLCRDVVPSQERVEQLVSSSKACVKASEVRAALQFAAGPYRALVSFYNELIVMYKHHSSASSSGASVKKLKAICLD